ncbi:MAG: hypothetical protein VX730_07715 [Pseudomonadota bacterium]|nr:hypothetical protein [Pseudomonadota bacterium]
MRTHSRVLRDLAFLKWFTFRHVEKEILSVAPIYLAALTLIGVSLAFLGTGFIVVFLLAYLMSAKYTVHDEQSLDIMIHDCNAKTGEEFEKFHAEWQKTWDAHQAENKLYGLKAKVACCCVPVTFGVSLIHPSGHLIGFALALFVWDVPMPWLMEKRNAVANSYHALKKRVDEIAVPTD